MTEQEMSATIVNCPSPYAVPLTWKPTQIEQQLERLGLTEEQCVNSDAVRKWCSAHKNSRYVPESVLKHFDLQLSHDDFGPDSPLLLKSQS